MRHIRRSFIGAIPYAGLLFLEAGLGTALGLSQQIADPRPTLELEKVRYVLGESIRIWVGVYSASDIPEALRESCFVHIVRPDGTRMDEHVSWPIDGVLSRGWKGGWEMGRRARTSGRYLISFEFAGQKTAEQRFEIVPNPFADSIEARWIFLDEKADGAPHAHSAVLHVENKTGGALRFAKPGLVEAR